MDVAQQNWGKSMSSLIRKYTVSRELTMNPIHRTLGLPVELSGSVSYVIYGLVALTQQRSGEC